MVTLLILSICLLILGNAMQAQAAQDDPRLEGLFVDLADAEDDGKAAVVEQTILNIWSRSHSPTIELLLKRATTAQDLGEDDAAFDFYDSVVELAPDFAEGWNQRALLHFNRENLTAAMQDLQQTLVLEPRHFMAMVGLGRILLETGDKEGALRVFEKAIDVHPRLDGLTDQIESLTKEVKGRRI